MLVDMDVYGFHDSVRQEKWFCSVGHYFNKSFSFYGLFIVAGKDSAGLVPAGDYPLITEPLIIGNYKIVGSQDYNVDLSILPTYTVNGTSFDSVYYFRYHSVETPGVEEIYFKKGVGLLKFVIENPLNKSYELLRFHINK